MVRTAGNRGRITAQDVIEIRAHRTCRRYDWLFFFYHVEAVFSRFRKGNAWSSDSDICIPDGTLPLWRRWSQTRKNDAIFPSQPRDCLMTATSFVIPVPPQPSLPVVGEAKSYSVRRIWCVGRNYLEHIREMGNDERAPPFFFAKHADMLVPDGATVPYPPLTKDLHHEVELIVAMKSGGLNIPPDKALDHVYGYAVGIDLTRRDLQIASRKKERPWEA